MLRIRPNQSPLENPRSWWKYAISCVTSRPNSRHWEDIKRIGQCRRRYIELVVKKNSKPSDGLGHHAGLTAKESEELLVIEDLLPLEALLAMHLVALRQSFDSQQRGQSSKQWLGSSSSGKTKSRFRIRGSSKRKTDVSYTEVDEDQQQVSASSSPSEQSPYIEASDKSGETTISLLQAMTLRLGRKKWFVDWKLHEASIEVVIGRQRRDRPALCLLVGTSGRVRSFGLGKRDVSLFITQCEMLHGVERVLCIGAIKSDKTLVEETDDLSDRSQIFDLGRITSSLEDASSGYGPDLQTPASFLDMPLHGTVCRLSAGKIDDAVKISMSAHPATLTWTTSLFDNVSEFFVDNSPSFQLDLANHVKSAATPLARKAQLALLSPASLSIHMNIAGPKIWVPLVSSNTEGTLFLDSGTLKISGRKGVGEPDVNWDIQTHDFGVNFVHGMNPSRFGSDSHLYHYSVGMSAPGRGVSSVVRPFSIDVNSRTERDATTAATSSSSHDLMRKTHVVISPICLNLVDAEMLARSFGKWYGRGLHFVERRSASSGRQTEYSSRDDGGTEGDTSNSLWEQKQAIPKITTLQVEKLEMALEGHSKHLQGSDERSLRSIDSLQEFDRQTRAYLIEVFQISLKRSHLQNTVFTRLTVLDASIVRLSDVSMYTPLAARRDAVPSENRILEKANQKVGDQFSIQTIDEDHGSLFSTGEGDQPVSDIFGASLVHNRDAHLDEVELDIDSVVLRVTPTTLKDCAKAFRRIAQLAQLVTKEMERKVHEEGRRARKRRRTSDKGIVIPSRDSQSALFERPISPAFSEAMTTFTDITAMEAKPTQPKISLDSSFLIRIVVKNSTLLAGRPTTTGQVTATHTRSSSFAVIQVLSNVLAMFQSIENPDATGTKTLHVSVDNVSALVTTQFERVSTNRMPPMIEPTGAEFRIVYATESFGSVVSQDASIDCDSVKACMTPNDLSIMANISRTMFERLRAFGIQGGSLVDRRPGFSNWIRYKKKGTGIATRVRLEVQKFSFVLLKTYKSQYGAPEFLEFNIDHVKGVLEGCVSALTGECTSSVSVSFWNSEIPGWEFVVEPFQMSLGVEQMPNELVRFWLWANLQEVP